MWTEMVNTYITIGVTGMVVVAFFVMLVWVIRTSKDREEKLMLIIDKLSDELPELRTTIREMDRTVKRIETRLDR